MPTSARGLPGSAGPMWWRVGPISLRSSSVSLVLPSWPLRVSLFPSAAANPLQLSVLLEFSMCGAYREACLHLPPPRSHESLDSCPPKPQAATRNHGISLAAAKNNRLSSLPRQASQEVLIASEPGPHALTSGIALNFSENERRSGQERPRARCRRAPHRRQRHRPRR